MGLCHICHTEVEGERALCHSRECCLAWQSLGERERRRVREGNVPFWQRHLKYHQQYRPAKVSLPKLRFMGEK
jgi:hypothetical protein